MASPLQGDSRGEGPLCGTGRPSCRFFTVKRQIDIERLDTARIYTKLNPSVYEDLYDEAGEKQILREVVETQQREIETLKTRLGEAQVGNPNTI